MDRPEFSIPLSDQQKRDWLRLIRSQNVGPASFFELIRRTGSARAALTILPELASRGGSAKPLRIPSQDDIDAEWVAGHDLGARLVARGDPDYPPLLTHIHSAPPLLWVRGDRQCLLRPCVAIVGSRNASATGRQMARAFATALGEAGFTVVSGLARGIDTAAHEASLSTGTVGVLASGIGVIYPPENGDLAEQLVGSGALISERMPFASPRGKDFPARNRIISGLCAGVFIVEAAQRSGTLITARYALEQGREVFAAPGNAADPRATGTNALLKSGAALVTEPADIIESLQSLVLPLNDPGLIGEPPTLGFAADGNTDAKAFDMAPEGLSDLLISLIGPSETAIDVLVRESGAAAGAVQAALIELELAGRVERTSQQAVRSVVTE